MTEDTRRSLCYLSDIDFAVRRIEALEAQIKAADALADILTAAMHEHDTANYGYGEENPWTMQEWFNDEDRAALSAYLEIKKQESNGST